MVLLVKDKCVLFKFQRILWAESFRQKTDDVEDQIDDSITASTNSRFLITPAN